MTSLSYLARELPQPLAGVVQLRPTCFRPHDDVDAGTAAGQQVLVAGVTHH